jgi:MFS family permease
MDEPTESVPGEPADGAAEPAGATAGVPWRSPVFYVIVSSSLMGVMGVSLLSPVLPELRPVFDVGDAEIGLLVTAYTLPGVFVTPFVGLLADRLGRRRVLVPLLFIFGLSGASIAFVTDFRAALALRLLQGVGASALITLAVTIAGDTYEGGQRETVIGVNGSATSGGAAVYPLLGGALAAIRWNVPFLFFGVGVFVGVAALVVLEDGAAETATDVRTYLSRLGEAARVPAALAVFAALFLAFFVFYGAILTALSFLLRDEFGLTASRIGPVLAMVALAAAVASSLFGRLSDWRAPRDLVALGFVCYGVSLLLLWRAPSAVTVAGSLLVFGVGLGILIPSIDTTVVAMVGDDLRAGIMSLRTSVLRVGQTLGPVAFPLAAETFFESRVAGYRTLLAVSGVALVAVGAVAYLVVRRR